MVLGSDKYAELQSIKNDLMMIRARLISDDAALSLGDAISCIEVAIFQEKNREAKHASR